MTTHAFASPELKDLEPWLVEQGAPAHSYAWVLGTVAKIQRSGVEVELVTGRRHWSASPFGNPPKQRCGTAEVIEIRVDFGNNFHWIGEISLG